MFGRQRIEYKSVPQMRLMRRAGLTVLAALEAAEAAAQPGVTTGHLNAVAGEVIAAAGATPSFLGYGNPPFTGVVCVSVNDEVVHGMPGERVLEAGDLVSVDVGAIIEGWHSDSARSFVVPGGEPTLMQARQKLSDRTCKAMWDGVAQVVAGNPLHEIGGAVEDSNDDVFGLVTEYTGHGIGTALHMPPEVLNYRTRQRLKCKPGLCVAVEPMLTAGSSAQTRTADDGWTVVTQDGTDAAHWEHTVALTPWGPWVLSAADGGKAELSARDVAHAPVDDDGDLVEP